MNILFCNYEYPPIGGGGGVLNAWLAEELAARHSVTVLTSGVSELSAEETVNGVRIVRVPVGFRSSRQAASMASLASYVIKAKRRGRRLLAESSFDIINTHFVVPTGPVGEYLSRLGQIPNVLSVHGGDLYDPSKRTSPHRHWWLRMVIRRLLAAADCVVGQSSNTVGNVARYYTTDVQVELIPLGIPRPPPREAAIVAESGEAAAAPGGPTAERFEMVTVGRVVARKGVDQLVDLLHRLAQPDMHLTVVGDGPALPAVRERAESLGVNEQITFAGHVSEEEKIALLERADVYVSTSQHEGFGLSYLEGMALGLPMVSYDEGGHTDFVEHERTGYLVPLNDLDAFCDRVEALHHDRALLNAMSARSLEVVSHYFIESCAERYEALFERVMAKHARAGH